jgi:erythrocyte band 7 integral membrane protein
MNQNGGSQPTGINPEQVVVRPNSQEKSAPGTGDNSQVENAGSQNILTRNRPSGQPIPIEPQGQGVHQPGHPQMMQGGAPMNQGFPPHQNQMAQPGMVGFQPQFGGPGMPGGQMRGPVVPGGQYGGPGMPGGQFGGPGMPGGQYGGPGMPGYQMGGQLQMRPINATYQQQPNRFANDNKGLQNMQAGNDEGGAYGESQKCWGQCTGWCGTWLPCLCCCPNPYQTIPEGWNGIIMRFGKFYKLVGPGMHYLIPDLDVLALIDKREKVCELKQQNVVSKDNTSFRVDAVLYYKITNAYKSKFNVTNLVAAIQDLAVTTLRNAVGRMTIQQFLELRDHFADQIEEEIAHIAEAWGLKVIRVLVQDVHLPMEFRNTFSTGAVSKRISEAQVIASKAEVEVARLMRDAAEALSTDAAFQIRYIDALESITTSANPKMIFFPASYNDVGTANADLLSSMADEMEGLLRNR